MSLRLHINPASQHARRVHVAALELGLPFETVMVDFNVGAHRAPEYLRHNPNGKVPSLEHDGFWLWESNAIMAYMADLTPGQTLYPTGAKARADVNRWLFWESAHYGPACLALSFERFIKPAFMKQAADPALVAQGEANFQRFGAVLNGQLEGREFVTDAFSLADIALASVTMYRAQAGIDLAPYPHLAAWLGRIEARDAWQKTTPRF